MFSPAQCFVVQIAARNPRIPQIEKELDALRQIEEELDALDNIILAEDQWRSKLQVLQSRVLGLGEGKSQNFPLFVDDNNSLREDCIVISDADLVAGEKKPMTGKEEMGAKYSQSARKRKSLSRPPSRSDKTASTGVGPSYNSMASLGMDPKNPMAAQKTNTMTLLGLGYPENPMRDKTKSEAPTLQYVVASILDPKNPNSTSLAAMDPTGQQLAAMYGMMPPGYPGMPTSSVQPSPRPPYTSSSMVGMFGGINPDLFGLDPNILSTMDPKLLQATGIDPKMMSDLYPKMTEIMDPRMIEDLKVLAQMDPKLLQAAGIDPSVLAKMLDPKALAGMDPKILASVGIVPKSSGDIAGAMTGAIDPQLMASMDPDILKSMGMNTKRCGLDSKSSSSSTPASSSASSMNDAILKSIGIQSKCWLEELAGMDPKMLATMVPKMLWNIMFAELGPTKMAAMMDPKLMARMYDPKMLQAYSMLKAYGTHPKQKYPETFTRIDPNMLGFDPKIMQEMDPKLLQLMGFDLEALGQSSSLAAAGMMDLKLLQMAGIDPKILAGMNPKVLAWYGIDPKLLAELQLKTSSALSSKSSSRPAYLDPKFLAAVGIDPKILEGMDPMGLDSKSLSAVLFPTERKEKLQGIKLKIVEDEHNYSLSKPQQEQTTGEVSLRATKYKTFLINGFTIKELKKEEETNSVIL